MNNRYGQHPQYNVNYNYAAPGKDQNRTALRIVGLIFSVVFIFTGLILFGISMFISKIYEKTEEQCSEKISAVITDNVKNTNSEGDVTFAPVYTFTVDGQLYTVQSEYSSSPAVYEIGDTAEIRYDPSDPKKVYDPKTLKVFWIVMKVFRYVGAGLGAVGVLAIFASLILTRKKSPAERDELEYYNRQ